MRIIHLAMRGRGRRIREEAIIQAFDAARIRSDAEAGKERSLKSYLDELRPFVSDDGDIVDAGLFATLDRVIANKEKERS